MGGLSTLDQVRQNVATAEHAGVGQLDEEALELIGRVQQKYEELSPVPCTKCGYCMPCPHGVNIPSNFELLNQAAVFGGSSKLLCRNLYRGLPEQQQAASCQACGECETKCPQQIEISQWMPTVHELLVNPE